MKAMILMMTKMTVNPNILKLSILNLRLQVNQLIMRSNNPRKLKYNCISNQEEIILVMVTLMNVKLMNA